MAPTLHVSKDLVAIEANLELDRLPSHHGNRIALCIDPKAPSAMRLPCTLSLLLLAAPASAFVANPAGALSTTKLNLFGGGGGGGDGAKKAPNMMEQMAMMKKAQEIAQQKRKIDEELSKMEFAGKADGVTIDINFIPSGNPMDPNPSYQVESVIFDDGFFEGSDPEALSTAVKDALKDGIESTNVAAAEKYKELQEGLMETLSQLQKPQ